MSTKVKQVAILGGRGYVGSEIIKILNNHDHFYIAKVFSFSAAGTLVDIYSKDKSLKYEQLNINIDLSNIDFVILALPNNASEPYINLIDNKYKKITINVSRNNTCSSKVLVKTRMRYTSTLRFRSRSGNISSSNNS